MAFLGFQMFGSAGKTMVEVSVIGFLMGTCIAFYVVIGDLSPMIISKIINVEGYSHDAVRRFLIIFITITCVVPLCFQKSIESLSFVCRASIGFYVCLTLKTVFESIERFENDPNWASNIDLWKPSGILKCIPIFSMAMSCQMQLFEVYETMGFPGSFDRIRKTVHHATSICCIVYCVIGFFGYLAFYNQTLSGNILTNFKPSTANDAITIGFILSIACSFPLVIFPCRTSLASFLHRKSSHSEIAAYVPESKYKPLTLFIIFSTMILGILVPSVEVIISLVGSTVGVLVCILFPATCFVKIMQKSSAEKTFAQIIIIIGFIIMILGTYANLIAIDTSQSGSHLDEKTLLNEPVIEHPKDDPKLVQEIAKPEIVKELEDTVKKKDKSEVKISEDGIKKEEQEIADEKVDVSKDPQVEIQEKNEEIQELKESNDKLEKEVLEMKEVLVKQNEETQKLVLQKFEEIAEKVDKIEKQSLESGPSAKDKPHEEVAKPENVEKIVQTPVVGNIVNEPAIHVNINPVVKTSEEKPENVKTELKTQEEEAKPEVLKLNPVESKPKAEAFKSDPAELKPEAEALKAYPNDSKQQAEALKADLIKSKPAAESLKVDPVESKPAAEDLKLAVESKAAPADTKFLPERPAERVVAKSEEKPVNHETRVDPIVKLIKSQEPLSYQVGEKMMESKKANGTINKIVKDPAAPNPDSSEIKNEMRKKRDTSENESETALNSLEKTLNNFELKSIITRELKATSDEA